MSERTAVAPLPETALDTIDERARRIRILLTDVDGVLTDGGLYYLDDGHLALRFHVRDGLGLVAARRAGLVVGLVSGRDVPQVRQRAAELALDEVHLGVSDKRAAVEEILARRGFAAEECCYIGDDVVDIPPMALSGLPVAVADAMPAVKDIALWITSTAGGQGAVREVVDRILASKR